MAKYKMYLAEQTTTWKYHGEIEINTDDIPALDGMSEYETKKHLSEHCGECDIPNLVPNTELLGSPIDEYGNSIKVEGKVNLKQTLDNQPESTTKSTKIISPYIVSHYIVINVD